MLYAFYGLDGRSAATHAALLAAFALAAAARPATMLRIAGSTHGLARIPETMPEALRIVEWPAAGSDAPDAALVETLIAEAAAEDRDIVLDLPLAWLARRDIRERADLAVVAVGPNPLDERLAASAIARLLHDRVGSGAEEAHPVAGERTPERQAPVWFLGCGRSGGGPDTVRFEGAMRPLLDRGAPADGFRFLPVALPVPTRAEAAAIAAGQPLARTLRQGILLLAAVEAAAGDPFAACLDSESFARSLGLGSPTLITADERRLSERLRDLADGLEALELGGPTLEELVQAPLMEAWSFQPAQTSVIAGVSFGHPTIPSGRRTLTTAVFATDGRTFARTLSRLYRLGTPAETAAGAALQ
ncbi:hypothetical protein [Methylobacterium durans]|uniref:Uncharacterized protein n=1 Tax=Methylobacterium durans TaxID=2202825 RepID=A0A2U8W8X3_9HYPH|nr:hypothetical protein [Methylobacterium durans]AWN42583.1 hypothetical protein DK389_21350 [Methylobacterium durans]